MWLWAEEGVCIFIKELATPIKIHICSIYITFRDKIMKGNFKHKHINIFYDILCCIWGDMRRKSLSFVFPPGFIWPDGIPHKKQGLSSSNSLAYNEV